MNPADLYREYAQRMEDFWGRRELTPTYERSFRVFGYPISMRSNVELVLEACDYSAPLFSSAAPKARSPFVIEIFARGESDEGMWVGGGDPGWPEYAGLAKWIALDFGAWGHCQVDLSAGAARAILHPEFAKRPKDISRLMLNTVLTNFMISGGLAMLHASCVIRDNKPLLMMAPHNAGKSTALVQLVLDGYRLVSDSQIYIDDAGGQLQLTGFPVGLVKLREDRANEFDELRPYMEPETVRGEVKQVVDIRALSPDRVMTAAIDPGEIEFCLIRLSGEGLSMLRPATTEEAIGAVMENSLFFDSLDVWERNLKLVARLLERSRCHHLEIGTDRSSLVKVVGSLWGAA